MRRVYGEELKKIQLDILDCVALFCEKNNISYWLDCGSLLGAIRHKGYIPWDDDIDIGMLREDYEKFAQTFNESNTRYRFVCIENTPGFYVPHGKIWDTCTVLYEPDEKGYKGAINIDVKVYDNAPDDDLLVKKMYDKRDALRHIFNRKNLLTWDSSNSLKNILKHIRKAFYRIVYPQDTIKKMVKNAKQYAAHPTTRVGNFTSFVRMICNKRVFVSFIDVEFEGKTYKAPVGYDEWLTSFYGDYMKLPAEEDRVSHHNYVAYITEDSSCMQTPGDTEKHTLP